MIKILIINAYTWYGKGDAALIIDMLYALRQHFLKYDGRIQVFKSILVLPLSYPKLAKAFTYLWQAIRYTCLAKLRNLKTSPSDMLKAYTEADLVISCGGSYLGGHRFGLLVHLYRIYLGKLLKKPIVLFCVSVEPCRNTLVEKEN